MERCVGCDAIAPAHPMAGIGWPIGFPAVGPIGVMRSYPVCERCWREPSHRRRVLKMHYFARGQAEHALARAGSGSIGG